MLNVAFNFEYVDDNVKAFTYFLRKFFDIIYCFIFCICCHRDNLLFLIWVKSTSSQLVTESPNTKWMRVRGDKSDRSERS